MTYWTFRLMIGFGLLAALVSLVGLWLTRRRASSTGCRAGSGSAAMVALALPFVANSVGWIFTEMGRQPWVVFGVLRTADGVSPGVGHRVGADLADRLHAAVRRARGRRRRADGPLRQGGPPTTVVGRHPPADTDEPRPMAVAY